jgi:phosphate:Na+ symporter
MIGTLLGGIGLFLLGMILMTEGLKAAAGDRLRQTLARLTGGAWRGFVSGLATTALVQSSSATVLATIGFVSAGLLTFTQAIGVIFGSNLGTTSTGWLVSLVGFKISIAAVALPIVGIGALARLLLRGKAAHAGMALAGFGVIFVGIDLLQSGMATLGTHIDPARVPGATLGGRMLLVAVGAVMTVVMQSSSAAVATTLAAVHMGTIGLAQAVPLVIGQNIGTTVTAAIAAAGASVPARRTALAHILFNAVAAIVAFALAPLFLLLAARLEESRGIDDPAVAIAAFHTAFNLIGVILLLPFARQFASLVGRLVPERRPSLTRNLDSTVAAVPAVASEAARIAVMKIAQVLVGELRLLLERARMPVADRVDEADTALDDVRRFLRVVRAAGPEGGIAERNLSIMHSIDHLEQLVGLLRAPPAADLDRAAEAIRAEVGAALSRDEAWLSGGTAPAAAELEGLSARMAEERRRRRLLALEGAAAGEMDPDGALSLIEALRWLDAALYHVWRSTRHLETGPPSLERPPLEAALAAS